MRANSSGVQSVRPGLALLVGRFGGQRLRLTIALPASSGWARISASCASRPASRTTLDERVLELREARERPLRPAPLRRSTASVRRCRRAARRIRRATAALSRASVRVSGMVSSIRKRWRVERMDSCFQWRAMSMRRQIQTRSCCCTWSRKRCSAREAPRAAEQAAVHADRSSSSAVASVAFGVQHVEGVAQVAEEVVAGVEALRRARSACRWCRACTARPGAARSLPSVFSHRHPERQVVAVVVAVVFVAAVVGDQPRVFGLSRPVYQPSGHCAAGQLADDPRAALDVRALASPRPCAGSGSSASRGRRSRGRARRRPASSSG